MTRSYRSAPTGAPATSGHSFDKGDRHLRDVHDLGGDRAQQQTRHGAHPACPHHDRVAAMLCGARCDLLARMPSGGMPVIFHKRNRKGTVVSMKEEDFFRIVALIRDQK